MRKKCYPLIFSSIESIWELILKSSYWYGCDTRIKATRGETLRTVTTNNSKKHSHLTYCLNVSLRYMNTQTKKMRFLLNIGLYTFIKQMVQPFAQLRPKTVFFFQKSPSRFFDFGESPFSHFKTRQKIKIPPRMNTREFSHLGISSKISI